MAEASAVEEIMAEIELILLPCAAPITVVPAVTYPGPLSSTY